MVFASDKTILENPHQHDYWSTTHVLIPYFVMFWDFAWYVPLLALYFLKAIESLPWLDYATLQDALIVDPVQAIFGITAFSVFYNRGLLEVVSPLPYKRNQFFDWWRSGAVWIPTLCVITALEIFDEFRMDYLYIGTFAVISAYTAYYQSNFYQRVVAVLYPLITGILIVSLNRIPYSGWYTSIWIHCIFVVPALYIFYEKWNEWSSPDIKSNVAVDETQKLVLSRLYVAI